MTVRTCAAATASLLGAVWGCGTTSEAPPVVSAVSPARAYNDAATIVRIEGTGFRPAYRFDTMGGAATNEASGFTVLLVSASTEESVTPVSVRLDAVSWVSPIELSATIPAAVFAGVYDVAVVDPRGQQHELPGGFTSLGPDLELPTVTIDNPGPRSIIGAGAEISGSVTARDGLGFIAAVTTTVTPTGGNPMTFPCFLPPDPQQATCPFRFTAPAAVADGDKIAIVAVATDRAGNESEPAARIELPLAPRPTLTGLTPSIGPADGGTEITLRGANFVLPTEFQGSQLLIDGQPVYAMVVDTTTLVATTPAHDPGHAVVTVSNGGAASGLMYFEFVDAPIIRLINPTSGAVTGGTYVSIVGNNFRGIQTTILIGGKPLQVCSRSSTRIDGLVPAGMAPGPVNVLAKTMNGGSHELPGAFTYVEAAVEPMSCADGPS